MRGRLGRFHHAALSVLVLGLCAPSADAFVRTRTAAGATVGWTDPSAILLSVARPPDGSGVSRHTLTQAARAAAASWNAAGCSRARLEVTTELAASDGEGGPRVTVSLWAGDSCSGRCPAYGEAALTTLEVDEHPKRAASAAIESARVQLNARDFAWNGSRRLRPADLQVVLTHEFGHVLGLADTCVLPGQKPRRDHAGRAVPRCDKVPARARSAVMFPGGMPSDRARRKLTADDVQGICSLYPKQ